MTMPDSIPMPSSDHDYLALGHEFEQLHRDVIRSNELERRQNAGEKLDEEEKTFLEGMPDKMRRACDITRILRRTNTGPAQVKSKKTRASKTAHAQETIDKLLDMD